MNLVRPRLSVRNLLGQRIRGMCSNKLQETKAEASPAASAQESHPQLQVPGLRPSRMDKKMLVWTGRFKSVDQIPDFVSFRTIDAARDKMRIKVANGMIVLTLIGCVVMVISGKRAAARHESLVAYNLEKKARWREEHEKEMKAQ
ncbi:protein FAM162B [Austrofundulus limnaeus]|uniref:Protein FAM162B n=1 Tax=Austrofundulus limnaeus TaxID=52670 RepID=A0A2I4AQA2_AUSLI|nr:PREDICTED: protein FAM162B-like [Austrofundulus limnaeus]